MSTNSGGLIPIFPNEWVNESKDGKCILSLAEIPNVPGMTEGLGIMVPKVLLY